MVSFGSGELCFNLPFFEGGRFEETLIVFCFVRVLPM